MKNIKKLFLFSIIALLIVCYKVDAKEYDLIIGDKTLNSINNKITDGRDGKAIWDSEQKTLILDNYNYEGTGTYIDEPIGVLSNFYTLLTYPGNEDIKIILKGENTFKLSNESMESNPIIEMVALFLGNVTFEGNGSLNIISSNEKKPTILAGLYGFGQINIYDATINFGISDATSESVGLHADLLLETHDAKLTFKMNGTAKKYALTSHIIKFDSSYISANLTDGIENGALEAKEIYSKYSIIDVVSGLSTENNDTVEAEEKFELYNSKLYIKSTGTAILSDEITVTNSDMEINANEEVLRRGSEIIFNGYDSIPIYLNKESTELWTSEKQLYNYKYLKTNISEINGKYILNIFDNKLMSKDIKSSYEMTDVDKLKFARNLNLSFILETDENYNQTDLDLINNNLKDYKLDKIININLYKQFGEEGRKISIQKLKDTIKLSYKLDSLDNEDREYKIFSVHDGSLDILDAELDSNLEELSFETDRFSTYAIVYKNVKKEQISNTKIENPKTGDYISLYLLVSIVSIITLMTSTLYLKRKNV